MKNYLKYGLGVFIIDVLCSLFPYAQNTPKFSELDSILKESSEVRVQSARDIEAWKEEKAHLESLYNAMLKRAEELEKRAKSVKESLEKDILANDALLEKIENDESVLKEIEAFLQRRYKFLSSKSDAANLSRELGVLSSENFSKLGAGEKFREAARLSLAMYIADKKIHFQNSKVSSGVFVRAEGVSKDGKIAVMKRSEENSK